MRTDLGADATAMARGAGVNLLGTLAALALGFVFMLAVTHLVSARAIGLVALGTTVVGFALIPSLLGLDTGIIRFVARAAATGDERAARGSLQAGLAVVSVTSILLTVAIWLLAPWIADSFFGKPDAASILRIVSLSLPAQALARATIAAMQGLGVMRYSAWLGILRRAVELGAVLPLVAVGLEASALALAAVAAAWVSFAISLLFLLRLHPQALVPARGAWPWFRLLNFSVPQVLTGLLFFAILWTDVLLLGRFGSAADVGIYSVLVSLMMPATIVSIAVGQMFAPRISVAEARGDRATIATMLKRVTHWNTAVSLPFFVILALIPGPLLRLFGETYEEGATALTILALGQLINTAAGPLGQVINMSGRQYLSLCNNALVATLNVGACLILIPRYGMAGAAASTAGALTLVNLIKLVEVRILFRAHPFRPSSLRLVLAAGTASALATPIAFLPSWPGPLLQVLAAGSALFLAYTGLAWILAASEEDRELLRLARAKAGRRLQPRALGWRTQ
jgi:O-antigen/teichoic acid export membrane protein